ncbi:hypothetical protein AMJ50_02680 [Parcubacteria bacterium DG_74_3]|nr:MAG: hypothetical protein AMJ50_02680 [Parcubacteria bacterium DG_74_3]
MRKTFEKFKRSESDYNKEDSNSLSNNCSSCNSLLVRWYSASFLSLNTVTTFIKKELFFNLLIDPRIFLGFLFYFLDRIYL